ncbi:hypothetical protein SBA1_270030 [Candidatus Sulfotelmatobacter kueseliae]|uniref:Uncharacterized protein n=1 Tax=Candidatus Sulfotelmatobacter kueseliae TaxID=2042962 RepID=A0A2U3KI18_9BACT|nr:hypothetical protein SBA1_270030 [Candidatus Sulfotelmatobacter kueseliae]
MQAADPGAMTVPNPRATSPCWAEARLAKSAIAKRVAKPANFLKWNLLYVSFLAVKMPPPGCWMQAHGRRTYDNSRKAQIQTAWPRGSPGDNTASQQQEGRAAVLHAKHRMRQFLNLDETIY